MNVVRERGTRGDDDDGGGLREGRPHVTHATRTARDATRHRRRLTLSLSLAHIRMYLLTLSLMQPLLMWEEAGVTYPSAGVLPRLLSLSTRDE